MHDATGSRRRKILWLIGLRAAVVTVLLGTAILVELSAPGSLPTRPFFFLIGLTYAFTAVYALTVRQAARYRWLLDLQLGADAFIVSAVVAFTGGVSSPFSSLYFLPVIAASVIESRRGGLMVAVLSSVTYGGVVLLQYTLPALGASFLGRADVSVLPGSRFAAYLLGLNVFGFVAVGALAGSLAEKLRRASTEIADLHALSRHIVDSLVSGLATTDLEGRIRTFNRAAEAITGHQVADVAGRDVTGVLQLPGSFAATLDVTGRRAPDTRIDFPYTRADGVRIDLGLNWTPLITSHGPSGLLFIFQDLTDIKKLEREASLQQRLAAVGEMAAGIAHEIRNPLASMSGSIQVLRRELPLTTEQAQLMDIVLRESERLNDTIRNFLAYARPNRLPSARLDLARLVSDTALLLRHSNEFTEGHEIELDLPGTEIPYHAEEAHIRQILWNLATNGLRAMKDGRLRMGARTEERSVVLVVEDQGVGIHPEELDTIFQPFRSAFANGTGLGLAIVHRIVKDCDGEIRVTSAPGAGTVVEIRLPSMVALEEAC